MSAARLVLLTLVCAAWAQVASAQTRARVDGIAAVIGAEAPGPDVDVVLLSDVELRARIVLAGRLGAPARAMRLPPEVLRTTLETLVGEALIARESRRVRVAEPSLDEVARERARLDTECGGADALRALRTQLGVPELELDEIAERRARVSAFLRANLEGATAVTDVDVDQAYEAHEHPFGDAPLEEVREPLRAWLGARALERAVSRWVAILRTRTAFRILVTFGD